MRISAVITAGGSGQRFGAKKQFLELAGVPILRRTVEVFDRHPLVNEIVVTAPEADLAATATLLTGLNKPCQVVAGGPTRQASVYAGLKAAATCEIVLIHDGVRPLVASELIERVIAGLTDADGCIPGLKLNDTIKRAPAGLIDATVARDELYTVQTPQAFRIATILKLHQQAAASGDADATDDSSLLEAAGLAVRIVQGEADNLKITLPADLALAERILAWRSESA